MVRYAGVFAHDSRVSTAWYLCRPRPNDGDHLRQIIGFFRRVPSPLPVRSHTFARMA